MSLKKKYLASKPECKVTFKLDKDVAKGYNEVNLVGEFNGWDEKKHPMKKLKSGDFSITINLGKDAVYQFKYLADKKDWINDSEAELVVNDFQGQNSVVSV
jgi:1,4-alpha-glucan branching enzyme